MSNPQENNAGLLEIYPGQNPVVDIVAVHGLNGDRMATWESDGKNWLKDFLPKKVPNARIYTFGYDARTHGTGLSANYLFDHATALISDLVLERKMTDSLQRPLIFLAHSLGGIIVKSALIHSNATGQGFLEDYKTIKLATYAVLFMGTPHQGTDSASWGKILTSIGSLVMNTNDRVFKHLERDSESLQQQQTLYNPISQHFVTKFFFEEFETIIAGQSVMVVPRTSAVVPGAVNAEGISMARNHEGMVKFRSEEDSEYKKVSSHIFLLVKDIVRTGRANPSDLTTNTSVTPTPPPSTIASAAPTERTNLYADIKTEDVTSQKLADDAYYLSSVAFSPDGSRIVSISAGGAIRLWDVETQEFIARCFDSHKQSFAASFTFLPDNQVISGHEKEVQIWDLHSGDVSFSKSLGGHPDNVHCVAFSPDGKYVAFGGNGKYLIWVVSVETGRVAYGPWDGHCSVTALAYSPDSTRMASGFSDGAVRVRDSKTGRVICDVKGGFVSCVTFSSNGSHVASISSKTIKVWKADTGRATSFPLQGHTMTVNCVSFSSDGSHIVSGSNDRTIRVWDAASGKAVLGPFEGHSGIVVSAAFSPDGKKIVSGCGGYTVRVWHLVP